jgi:hypothetical protein
MNDVATLTDEDTANFCTLSPLSGGLAPYNANLSINQTAGSWNATPSTFTLNTGKWYFESGSSTLGSVNYHGLGLRPVGMVASGEYCGSISGSYGGIAGPTAINLYSGGALTTGLSGTYTSSSVFQCAVDFDAGKIWFGDGTSWAGGGNPSTGTTPSYTFTANTPLVPYISAFASAPSVNFGQRPFKYTPPTGYKKLNTYNLPDSTIKDGSQYFDVVTRAGNSSSFSVTGLQFSPDFFWTKCRNTALSHYLADTVRGDDNILFSNLTNAEVSEPQYITAISSDGYTLGAGANVANYNGTGGTYVDWIWRGSDSSAVSNTDGTITSTVSANTDAGFSIVTYTGTAAVATVGHGLGVAPSMIITKNRDTTTDWWVYHAALGSTKYMVLNTTAAAVTSSTAWNNTSPTSTVFTLGGAGNPSNANQDVAYCFAEVEGFSKFGSYTGNGSSDGPFIYTGFRPAFVLIKQSSVSGNSWQLLDTARETINPNDQVLFPNLSNAEGTLNATFDFLSNGLKIRTTDGTVNTNGATYIYMAFAENPFKHSLAR